MAHRAPSSPIADAISTRVERDVRLLPEVEAEVLQAMAEIDRGEYIELTFEQLDRAVATGEWPWPDDESRG